MKYSSHVFLMSDSCCYFENKRNDTILSFVSNHDSRLTIHNWRSPLPPKKKEWNIVPMVYPLFLSFLSNSLEFDKIEKYFMKREESFIETSKSPRTFQLLNFGENWREQREKAYSFFCHSFLPIVTHFCKSWLISYLCKKQKVGLYCISSSWTNITVYFFWVCFI